MVHKTSFRLLEREDLEPVPRPQAETYSTHKERRKELNRIGSAIRARSNKIKHPGCATELRRIKRHQQKREQEDMNSKNNCNHAHRDLDSLDLERTMTSSVSHIAAATQAQAARRNRTCTGVRQETRDGKLVGRPYSYMGRYVDNLEETDECAVVSLKDGTTRIEPWANGKPIRDSWKDYELLSVAPPRSRPTPPNCRTEKRAPTITPTKKRKQSPVMTSREKKNRKF
jgi:hypothetical protein